MQQDHQDGDGLHEEAEDEEEAEEGQVGEEESGGIGGGQHEDEEDSVLLQRPGMDQRVRGAHRGVPAGEQTKNCLKNLQEIMR